jgi:Zn-dependent protease
VHEVAHGWMALRLGDSTARDLGRLTFNPIPHIDPIGSIAIPLLSLYFYGMVFIAWAKPVPVNPAYFQFFRRDDILVSIAGPVSNLLIALGCTVCYIVSVHLFGSLHFMEGSVQHDMQTFVTHMFASGITLNIFLAVFNLIPVPPLDGSHVLSSILPPALGERYQQVGFFGILIVIMLMRLDPVRNFILTIVFTMRAPYEFLINQFI